MFLCLYSPYFKASPHDKQCLTKSWSGRKNTNIRFIATNKNKSTVLFNKKDNLASFHCLSLIIAALIFESMIVIFLFNHYTANKNPKVFLNFSFVYFIKFICRKNHSCDICQGE
jgi:hypothetical protein